MHIHAASFRLEEHSGLLEGTGQGMDTFEARDTGFAGAYNLMLSHAVAQMCTLRGMLHELCIPAYHAKAAVLLLNA
eukprot:365490-Chlamydomonas_euryale.AAC.15